MLIRTVLDTHREAEEVICINNFVKWYEIQLQYADKDTKTVIQVIMLVEPPSEEDETTYLLKSETNKKHLLKALENVEKGNLIFVNLDEYEKIVFEPHTNL